MKRWFRNHWSIWLKIVQPLLLPIDCQHKNAKRILVLTEEGIEESGSHEELLSRNGVYAGLYRMAYSEQI